MIDKHRSQKTDDNNNQAKDNVAESVKLTVIVQEEQKKETSKFEDESTEKEDEDAGTEEQIEETSKLEDESTEKDNEDAETEEEFSKLENESIEQEDEDSETENKSSSFSIQLLTSTDTITVAEDIAEPQLQENHFQNSADDDTDNMETSDHSAYNSWDTDEEDEEGLQLSTGVIAILAIIILVTIVIIVKVSYCNQPDQNVEKNITSLTEEQKIQNNDTGSNQYSNVKSNEVPIEKKAAETKDKNRKKPEKEKEGQLKEQERLPEEAQLKEKTQLPEEQRLAKSKEDEDKDFQKLKNLLENIKKLVGSENENLEDKDVLMAAEKAYTTDIEASGLPQDKKKELNQKKDKIMSDYNNFIHISGHEMSIDYIFYQPVMCRTWGEKEFALGKDRGAAKKCDYFKPAKKKGRWNKFPTTPNAFEHVLCVGIIAFFATAAMYGLVGGLCPWEYLAGLCGTSAVLAMVIIIMFKVPKCHKLCDIPDSFHHFQDGPCIFNLIVRNFTVCFICDVVITAFLWPMILASEIAMCYLYEFYPN